MALLFNRQYNLEVNGVSISSSKPSQSEIHQTLRMRFKIEKDLKKFPNSAEIAVWNLNKETRAKLSDTQKFSAKLSVGYGDQLFLLYSGDLYRAVSMREGPNWITKMAFKDGGKNQNEKRITESAAAGTPLSDAIQKAANAMGFGLGNLPEHLTNVRSKVDVLPKGITISGNAVEEFGKLMGYTGQNWSIQDGQIQVLIPGQSLPNVSELISVETGMIGEPEIGDQGQTRFKALIRPNMFPGCPVELQTKSGIKSGSFLIIHSIYNGDTHDRDWQVECEAYPLGAKSRTAESQASV